jgi:CubicO group peptidase (beta-lactamase class C family)
VQDPACKYVEGCPPEWQAITIHHLLTHTSGISDTPGEISPSPTPVTVDLSFEQLFDLMKATPLSFEPGSQFLYSNLGYVVLGHIIEQVSGEDYAGFVGRHILTPLGMANSSFGPAGPGATRAVGYLVPGKPAPVELRSMIFPAGGMFSTASDLFLWDQALYTEKLLSKASLDAIFTPNLQEYGYGWLIHSGVFGKEIAHNGEILGFVSGINRYVDRHSTVIVLSNDELADVTSPTSITSRLAHILFKQR